MADIRLEAKICVLQETLESFSWQTRMESGERVTDLKPGAISSSSLFSLWAGTLMKWWE